MITAQTANTFAEEWIAAWNSHNLERILSHYTDDFVFESPYASKVVPESNGVIIGKDAARSYWKKGLALNLDLVFEIQHVFTGINGLTIYYINKGRNKRVAEVMFLNNEGKAYKSFAYYEDV